MIISFFQKKTSFFLLVIAGLILWYQPLFDCSGIVDYSSSPLLKLTPLPSVSTLAYNWLVFITLIAFSGIIISLSSTGRMYGEKLCFAMFVFIVLSSYEVTIVQENWGFLTLIILTLSNYLVTRNQELLTPGQSYNAGLLFGMAILLCPISILLIPNLLLSIFAQQSKSGKCYITALMGILSTLILFVTLVTILNKGQILSTSTLTFYRSGSFAWREIYLYIPTILFIVYSIFVIAKTGRFFKKDILRYYESLIMQLLYTLAVLFILPQSIATTLPISLLIGGILINKQFYNLKNKLGQWLIVIYLVLCISSPFWLTFSNYVSE